MCAKPLKPVCLPDPKVEPKKEEAKPAPQPKKTEEKVKDNVESLPPTNFNLLEFKKFFMNHPDRKGEAVDEMIKQVDWDGFAFWHLHYDKLDTECKQVHVTNNLLNGFLQRADHVRQYVFGRHCVLGDEPNLDIKGVWLMRGTELPDGLVKEHSQFEYYKTRKMDPRNNA